MLKIKTQRMSEGEIIMLKLVPLLHPDTIEALQTHTEDLTSSDYHPTRKPYSDTPDYTAESSEQQFKLRAGIY